MKTLLITQTIYYCFDSVLQAESVDVEVERHGYEFPVAGQVVGLDTANGSEATINIPQELLLARANGMPMSTISLSPGDRSLQLSAHVLLLSLTLLPS